MSGGPLVLAVPSKGRLQENAAAFFARAGLVLSQGRGVREYRGAISGVPDVEVLFLSASEIVSKLAAGGAHLGVTGQDLIREGIADAAERVELLTPLGFGQANVVVCVPQAWIDVRTMADLEEVAADLRARHALKMRVATKYVNLTRRFFAERGVQADVRLSYGASEAKIPDIADCVVDITETGRALRAAGLRVIDTILVSYTEVIAHPASYADPAKRKAMEQLMTLLRGALEARGKVLLKVNVTAEKRDAVLAVLPSAKSPTVNQLANGDYAIESVVPKSGINLVIPALTEAGATDLLEIPISKIVH